MIPSVSPEAERELTEGALFYAREGGADLGLAFIAEFERVLALLCTHPQLGASWRRRRRLPLRKFHTAWSTTSVARNCEWLPWPTMRGGLSTGRVGSRLRPNLCINRSAQQLRCRVPAALRASAPAYAGRLGGTGSET